MASFRASLVLLAFYWTSSKMTAYCEDRKSGDEDFKAGGQRDWKQVGHSAFPADATCQKQLGQSQAMHVKQQMLESEEAILPLPCRR